MMSDEVKTTRSLASRTKAFALRIVKMYATLPRSTVAQVLGKQVLRSGTSVGAHYFEGQRARSTAEFVSKLELGIQELSETAYWLDLLVESKVVPTNRMADLRAEADELIAILVASVKTAKRPK